LQVRGRRNKQYPYNSLCNLDIQVPESGSRVAVGKVAGMRDHSVASVAIAGEGEKTGRPSTGSERQVVSPHDDLAREVYCILGIAVDAVDMGEVVRLIERAAPAMQPFVIGTPNINFLVTSQVDPQFREALLLCDLCPVDGMPIVWIARLLGIPISQRVAGSDIFKILKSRPKSKAPLRVFLFGASEPVAKAAASQLNQGDGGLQCVGWACPGFGDLDQLSEKRFIDQINASGADFLVAALGARKGQLWLQRNHHCLQVPIRAHLGAVINFEAGTIKRAPGRMGKLGLEWLWRIREEPALWRRYWHDGKALFRIFLTQIVPLAVVARRQRASAGHDLVMVETQNNHAVTVCLTGDAVGAHIAEATAAFRRALETGKQIVLDCSGVAAIDARFFGLLLMLRKQLVAGGNTLRFTGVSVSLRRQFRLHSIEHIFDFG
jgi:N-acetylglucosaminyldiphosphoundecaprenol N-acetyl-beta-D-mannosaminyltransferase